VSIGAMISAGIIPTQNDTEVPCHYKTTTLSTLRKVP